MLNDSVNESYYVNMLISLLLRFPEIYTINFYVTSSSCRLTYMVKRQLIQDEFLDLQQQLQEHLEAFYYFHDCDHPCRFKILKNIYPGLTQIQIVLSIDYLLGDAISLLTKMIHNFFKEDLLVENRPEKEYSESATAVPVEELLSHSPAAAPNRKVSRLFAFCDAGKVYVFDK